MWPHPTRASVGYPDTSVGSPHPTRAFGAPPPPPPGGVGSACDIRGAAVPGSSPGSPHAVDRGDIATGGEADGEGELVPPPLSPTLQIPYFCRYLPPHLRLRQQLPILLCRPPPRPRLRRSPPAPPRAGAVLAISGEQPYPGFLQDLPMCWTVGISRLGVGPTGRGNLFPLPCLQLPRHRNPCRPHPSRASRLFSRSRSCGYRHEKGGSASPRRRTSISSPACRRSRNGHPDRFITP